MSDSHEMERASAAPGDNKTGVGQDLLDWAEAIVFSLVVVVLLFTFVFRIITVDGESMLQTLQDQDRLIVSHLFYQPQRGDIVVVNKPDGLGKPIIKRIIALEGDEVDIDFVNGYVSVNGERLDEPYVNTPTTTSYDVRFPVTVPEDCVFVMGDNRNDSTDSRDSRVGFVNEGYILGKAVFRLFPFKTFGFLE